MLEDIPHLLRVLLVTLAALLNRRKKGIEVTSAELLAFDAADFRRPTLPVDPVRILSR
jgi:hypothetical protein